MTSAIGDSFRAPRQDAQSLLEDSPWESLQAIIEKEPSMQLLPKSAPLLAWIEQHESDFAEGSLAHWLAFRIATCLEEDIEDAHGIHCAAAQLRKLQIPQQKQSFSFHICQRYLPSQGDPDVDH